MEPTLDDILRALDAFIEKCRTLDPHSVVTGDVLASFGGLVTMAIRKVSEQKKEATPDE
jgi:hypothetical protein